MAFSIFLSLTVLWFVLMTWLSHQNGERTGRASRRLTANLKKHIKLLTVDAAILNRALRRFAHIFLFMGFTVLLGMTLYTGGLSGHFLWFSVIWSYLDERTKPFVEGRHFSWSDVGRNLAGVLLGIVLLLAFHNLFLLY